MTFVDLESPGSGRPTLMKLATLAFLGFAFCLGAPAHAQNPTPAPATPATVTPSARGAGTTPGAATPATPSAAPAAPGGLGLEHNMPGVAANASAQMLVVKARPVAFLTAKAEWGAAFASIKNAQAQLRAAVEKAGLKPAGHPITVFTRTDDKGFAYEAMLPIATKPGGTTLTDTVKLGSSPSGKAIKFQHHGPYDDIDSTYDLITAYLDEKGLEAQDYFVEDYVTDLKSADDPNLAVDIYIFLK